MKTRKAKVTNTISVGGSNSGSIIAGETVRNETIHVDGTYVGGDVTMEGGDFTGRDSVKEGAKGAERRRRKPNP